MDTWRKEEYWVIEYREFDKLVQERLGVEGYEIIADQELRNDMTFRIGAIPCPYWSRFDEEDLAEVLLSWKGPCYASHLLAHELQRRGVIPSGKWLVEVSW